MASRSYDDEAEAVAYDEADAFYSDDDVDGDVPEEAIEEARDGRRAANPRGAAPGARRNAPAARGAARKGEAAPLDCDSDLELAL